VSLGVLSSGYEDIRVVEEEQGIQLA